LRKIAILTRIMNTVPISIFLIALFTATATLASEKSKDGKNTKSAKDDAGKATTRIVEKKDGILLTGSHIRQDVRRAGRITDGSSQVVVIDRQTIERSGGGDLRQVLAHTGVR